MPSRLTALALALAAPLLATAAEVTLFAAASLSDALREIAAEYEAATGDAVRLNLAGSSALARQIQAGAPADLFFAADEAKMDALQSDGLLLPGSRRPLLSNSLVIVVHAKNGAAIASPSDLAAPAVRRIALAEPSSVPAGIYARQFLENIRIWDQVSPKLVPTANVRAALAALESGNVEAAIVYRTDVRASANAAIAYQVPPSESPAISYPLAILQASKQPAAAARLALHLASPPAQAIFAQHGFLPPSAISNPQK